jgi:hypothetical protein
MPRVRSLRSPRRAVPLVRAAVSASSHNDPVHWQGRAEEVRSLADGIHDLVPKARILRIAQDYERLAERGQWRDCGNQMPQMLPPCPERGNKLGAADAATSRR